MQAGLKSFPRFHSSVGSAGLVFLRRCIFHERLCKHVVFPLRASVPVA